MDVSYSVLTKGLYYNTNVVKYPVTSNLITSNRLLLDYFLWITFLKQKPVTDKSTKGLFIGTLSAKKSRLSNEHFEIMLSLKYNDFYN